MEIGLDKLLLFPEKLAALQAEMRDDSYPVSVELSLTNDCNQNCVWCSDYELRNRLPGALPTDTLFRLIDDLAAGGTRGITIEGGGEPTLHPDFAAIIRHIRQCGLAVGMITNGIELPYAELIDEFEWIRVSLDAGTPEEYRKLKGADYFDKVMANIRAIAAHRKTVCGVGYIVTRDNVSALDALVPALKQAGIAYVHFRPVIDHPEMFIDTDLSRLQVHTDGDFAVIADGLQENKIRGNAGLPCRAHSVTTIIAANGDVFICGRLNIYDWLSPLGNILRTGFCNIWHGEERQRQSAMIADAAFCRANCPECRLTKYNILLDRLQRIRTRRFI